MGKERKIKEEKMVCKVSGYCWKLFSATIIVKRVFGHSRKWSLFPPSSLRICSICTQKGVMGWKESKGVKIE